MASGIAAGAGPEVRFQGMAESVAPMCPTLFANLAQLTAFRPGPDQILRRAGRKHAYPSSRRVPAGYSSIGLLASIARLRFTGTRNLTCTFHPPPGKRGHFYFASRGTFLLCLDTLVQSLAATPGM
jgi:hypothetical protein